MPPTVAAETRVKTTIGALIVAVGAIAAAAGWATAVDAKFSSIVQSVQRIEDRVEDLADFNTRISLLEAAVSDLKQQLKERP